MAGMNEKKKSRNFSNILWLNMKRLRVRFFWRGLFILLNFLVFAATTLTINPAQYGYVFLIAAVANVLFISLRAFSDSRSMQLLRSLGASRSFIVFDHLTENLIEWATAVLISLPVFVFRKGVHAFVPVIGAMLLIGVLSSVLCSLWALMSLEKQNRDL